MTILSYPTISPHITNKKVNDTNNSRNLRPFITEKTLKTDDHDLAKVEVGGSNPLARSNLFNGLAGLSFPLNIDTPPYPHKLIR